MADDILSKIKGDNATAQLVRCGGCMKPMAQNGAPITESNYVNIKNKKLANSDKAAKGFLCNSCLKDEQHSAEGPRESVALLNDRVMLTNWDNLVDMKEGGTEQAVTDTGKTVTRSTATGTGTGAKKK
jgi:hypothetical protein